MELQLAKTLIASIYIGFACLELAMGRFAQRDHTKPRDVALDVASVLAMPLLVAPIVLWASPMVAEALWADSAGQFSHTPWWGQLGILLIADDLSQYGWHRLSHTRWLYPLHRAHHSAEYMSVRVVYRNNLFYYALMPGVWLSGMLVHWGFGPMYALYLFVKMTVIVSAHSSVPWDEPLYRHPLGARIMWWVERIISTPATHSAHHGLHAEDGVTHYQGNFGNLLFFWDVCFGTAHITRRRPDSFGVEGLEPVSWIREFLVPSRSRQPPTEEGPTST